MPLGKERAGGGADDETSTRVDETEIARKRTATESFAGTGLLRVTIQIAVFQFRFVAQNLFETCAARLLRQVAKHVMRIKLRTEHQRRSCSLSRRLARLHVQ
jgi:hypothetical protein